MVKAGLLTGKMTDKSERSVVIVTGGCGFIGSHTVVSLLEINKFVVIIDNLCNSYISVLDSIKSITSSNNFIFHQIDINDWDTLRQTMQLYQNRIECVIHFAALKAVGESVSLPLDYYNVNVGGTINVLRAMKLCNAKRFIFSSSATVYGDANELPVKETTPCGKTTNPYGTSKVMIETILKDLGHSDSTWSICILRYFNPIGAHPSGLIGESGRGTPNNLLPYITRIYDGEIPFLSVYGNDYDTIDGTGVRDFIHVVDLANGHIAALNYSETMQGVKIFNLGTGKGHSVLEVVAAMEKVSGKPIEIKIMDRRVGDVAASYADASYAKSKLGWEAKYTLDKMCDDLWNYVQKNRNKNKQI